MNAKVFISLIHLILYSFFFTTILIEALFVKVGNYPEYQSIGVNLPECGFRYKPKVYTIFFDKKCFLNDYSNETLYLIDRTINEKQTNPIQTRIYEGIKAFYGEAPWAVDLRITFRSGDYSECSGVLITFEWILTAAHCIKPDIRIAISAGNNRKSKGWKRSAHVWHKHPEYVPTSNITNSVNDIALVKVDYIYRRVVDSAGIYIINPICLPNANQTNGNEWDQKVTFFGFGKITYNKISDVLRKFSSILVPFTTCNNPNLCLDHHARITKLIPNPCPGDSGGGLVQYIDKHRSRAILVGIHSHSDRSFSSDGCDKKSTVSFYVAVSLTMDWILKTIVEN